MCLVLGRQRYIRKGPPHWRSSEIYGGDQSGNKQSYNKANGGGCRARNWDPVLIYVNNCNILCLSNI